MFEREHQNKLELLIDHIVNNNLNFNLKYIYFFFLDGFAFSQEENGLVPQDQLIRNCDTNIEKPLGI